jgi:hypothetical protein
LSSVIIVQLLGYLIILKITQKPGFLTNFCDVSRKKGKGKGKGKGKKDKGISLKVETRFCPLQTLVSGKPAIV